MKNLLKLWEIFVKIVIPILLIIVMLALMLVILTIIGLIVIGAFSILFDSGWLGPMNIIDVLNLCFSGLIIAVFIVIAVALFIKASELESGYNSVSAFVDPNSVFCVFAGILAIVVGIYLDYLFSLRYILPG